MTNAAENQNQNQQNYRRQSTFKITSEIGILSKWSNEAHGNDNTKEINRVSWDERNPVIDIRSWWLENGEKKPGKGITLNEREAYELCRLLVASGYNEDKRTR